MRSYIILIIIVSILAIGATVGTIIVGSSSFEGIVTDKPYEAGLAWDEVRRNRERLGWSVSLRYGRFATGTNDLAILAVEKSGYPLADATVSVTVTRPSTRAYDRTYEAVPERGGLYRAGVDLPLRGNWDIVMDVRRGTERAVYQEQIVAEEVRK